MRNIDIIKGLLTDKIDPEYIWIYKETDDEGKLFKLINKKFNTRIIKPGQMITCDFISSRINIYLDKSNKIKRIGKG
jgi:hypothetical protein